MTGSELTVNSSYLLVNEDGNTQKTSYRSNLMEIIKSMSDAAYNEILSEPNLDIKKISGLRKVAMILEKHSIRIYQLTQL